MKRQHTQIFVLRVWKEGPKKENWRGNIQNVRTGQNRSIANLDEVMNLFQRYFREEARPQTRPEKGLK